MKKVVVIGGGSGTFSVLKGLKEYPLDISAVVTMFDSGGSSGVLRDEHGILPPGDVRRCLLALADESKEEVLRELFNHRFQGEGSLKNHAFGNILLTALTEVLGSEEKAIRAAGTLLNIEGKVIPVSLEQSHLTAILKDGTVVEGETNIDIPKHDASIPIDSLYLSPEVSVHSEAADVVKEADLIVFGPGDLYTSIIPNLLTKGMEDALSISKAKKVYVLNLFTKWGETHHLSASECAKEVLSYAGLKSFDAIIYNTAKAKADIIERYRKEKKEQVTLDDQLKKCARRLVGEDMFSGDDLLRHDSKKLAAVIMELA